jgi:preprotein translocase subunit SecG
MGGVKKTTDFLDNSTWFLAGALLLLILFSNITLNSGDQNSDSELINNNSDFEIEEILENDNSQNESE